MDLDLAGGLAGYRVLRRLGTGLHSTIYLAREVDSPPGPTRLTDDGPYLSEQPPAAGVAIRVFDASAPPEAVAREVRALCSMTGGVPQLYDVATLPDGRVALVHERLAGVSVARLLSEWNHIEPGEAVTIIAPIVAALAELHSLDLVHTGLSLATISLAGSGRPVLTGLAALIDAPPRSAGSDPEPNRPERADLIRSDYDRLTAVMRAAFDYLDDSSNLNRRAEPIAAWFEMATTALPFVPCLDELERRLFAWAPGAPLRQTSSHTRTAASIDLAAAARDGVVLTAPDVAESDGPAKGAAPVAGSLGLLPRLQAWVRSKRNPLIVAAMLTTAGVVLALTILQPPPGAGDEASGVHDAPPATSPITRPDDDVDDASLAGDDPVAATEVLLRRRNACIQAASLLCLSDVDQSSSAILEADSYSIRLIQQGGAVPAGIGDDEMSVTLVERTGDAAIVTWTVPEDAQRKPASLLVIKGEAGWRLRELFD